MDTELLKTFLTVAKLKSFTLAARELQLTQPALSKRIKRLEQIMGAELFDRVGNHVIETESGRILREKAPAILNKIDNTVQEIRDLTGNVSGQLRIGTSHYIGLHLLPKYLENFVSQFPEVDLHIDFIDSELAYERVLNGELELALLTFPNQQNQRLTQGLIWQEAIQIVCHQDYPLNKIDNPLQHLADYPCILPPAHSYPRELFEQELHDMGLSLGKVKTANYLEVIATLVSCKMGWTLLPEPLVQTPLTNILPKNHSISRRMGLVFRSNKTLSNAAKSFVSQFPCDF